jgi:putative FmdB family regulatory protein
MPIYEYRCMDCGKTSEIFLRTPNSGSIECPICGGKNVERLLSASYAIKMSDFMTEKTCCGRTGRCEMPPCSTDATCRREK